MPRSYVLLLVLLGFFTACAYTPLEETSLAYANDPLLTERYGTKQFRVPASAAFVAVTQALQSEGFKPAIVNESAGIIRTAPRLTGLVDTPRRRVGTEHVQITARLEPVDDRVKVAFHVVLLRDGLDVTSLDRTSEQSLKELWGRLFQATQDALPVAPPAAPDGELL